MAHLASLQQYDNTFLRAYTKVVPQELGLRAPTLAEARAADQELWTRIFNLVEEHGWGLEDALHEITNIRGDIDQLMQPRPTAAGNPRPPQQLALEDIPRGGGNKKAIIGKNKARGKATATRHNRVEHPQSFGAISVIISIRAIVQTQIAPMHIAVISS